MSAKYPNIQDLRAAGIKALQDALGIYDATEFLWLWRGTPGKDCVKQRREQPERSFEEMVEDIMLLQEAEEMYRRKKDAELRAKEDVRHAEMAGA